MKYKLHVAYMNREDLTREAIESVRDIGNIHLWPNNGALALDIPNVTDHVLPDMSPISVINMMIQSSWDDDVMFWAHNDCLAHPGAAAEFLQSTEELFASDKNWAVYFTLYDILCAFNMKAIREIGYWDPMFWQYTADNDYYHRVANAGYSIEQWLVPGCNGRIEHRGSMTVRSDPLFNHRTQFRANIDREYFKLKWGEPPGKVPFAGLNPPMIHAAQRALRQRITLPNGSGLRA